MNKPELTAYVAKATNMTQEQAAKAIDAIVSTIQDTLAAGNEVALIGFGSFSVMDRSARIGKNPRTGEAIQIAATRLPHFKPGQTLKTAVALKAVEAPKSAVATKITEPPKAAVTTKTAEPPKPKKDEKK